MIPTPYISASSVATFEGCPYRWACSQFQGKKGNMDSARWGIQFHSTIEKLNEIPDDDDQYALVSDMFGDEADHVWDAIVELRFADQVNELKLLASEKHFEVPLFNGAITLVGHIDELLESSDGKSLTIRDFKTTLKYEPAVVWNNKVQPRCYNYAVRKLFPDKYEHVYFQIVYPRQGKTVDWEMEEETETFENYVGQIWNKIVEYHTAQDKGSFIEHFPQIINEACKYCAVSDECKTYQGVISGKHLNVFGDYQDESPVTRYIRLESLAKLIEGEKEKCKAQIEDRFSPGDKSYSEDGHTFIKQTNSNRKYSVAGIIKSMKMHGIPITTLNFDKIFSVVIGEVNKVTREHPELNVVFEENKTVEPGSSFLKYAGSRKPKL